MNWRTAAKLNGAKHASRFWRQNGRPGRWVYLYDSKSYNDAKCIGKVDPKTMERVTALGLWEHNSPTFREGSDTAYEYWWLVEASDAPEAL